MWYMRILLERLKLHFVSNQIAKVLGCYCGCLRTEDEVEGSQHWLEDRG